MACRAHLLIQADGKPQTQLGCEQAPLSSPCLSQKKQETIPQINVSEAHPVRMRFYRFQSDSMVDPIHRSQSLKKDKKTNTIAP
jgi:hypothetical protein